MTISLDLEENEIKTLFEFAGDLSRKGVLEIGCGDGRLTWRYAAKAAQVIAIDPNPEKVSRAEQNLPAELSERVTFHAIGLEEFAAQDPPDKAERFDLILLSWSL